MSTPRGGSVGAQRLPRQTIDQIPYGRSYAAHWAIKNLDKDDLLSYQVIHEDIHLDYSIG